MLSTALPPLQASSPASFRLGSFMDEKPEPVLTHQLGKTLLRRAGTLLSRYEAIKAANRLGMSLNEIETYLDWLDSAQVQPQS